MTERINAKGTVLKKDDARYSRNKESAERRNPATPDKAENRRQHKRDERADPMDVAMLPPHERIFLQVDHIVEGRERHELEHQPANVGVEKPFGDAVRVFLVINVLVVAAVLTSP